ncbi:polyphosphate kinase 2 family protein [Bifidobacterium sp. MA2]|uniref:Polyphosphate kinase 2 family protein n=1 Tax=Bifidobacterium santillanense TaxID=2809028 RepID=A0ABS5UPY0_9BIFI|nr:PPK2 family polyphosphate kinase [Bifidobacterium santillanense]MBT1173013.1 polyphosphate kinase 2 family protein [Bifidobacterium santillanense]
MAKDDKDIKDDRKPGKGDKGRTREREKDRKPSKSAGKRIDRAMDLAEERIGLIEESETVAERLANAAKSSELLSAVWSMPPAQRLMFHHGVDVADLAAHGAGETPGFEGDKYDAERFIDLSASGIARYQRLMYANGVKGSNRRLLIVLQGMDASGKGGIVRHVFRQGDPMGIHYHGFGKPTEEEASHGFLWRVERELPDPGWIAVFDRSHYEDIVMPHVYGTFPEDVWRARYDLVNEFERSLAADGCAIIKIFLVSSREEQRRHFLARLDDPTKYWKFDVSDLDARDRWDDYMAAWQEVFERTSTPAAPWYLVPADNRWYSRAVVSELLRTAMRNMNMTWPPLEANVDPSAARRRLGGA